MAQLTGIARIKIDSDLLETLPGATIDIGGYERSPQKGHALYGYTQQLMEATVTCTIVHGAATDLRALANVSNATISFECDSGPQYVVSGAFATKPPVLTTGADSNVALEFKGSIADQA